MDSLPPFPGFRDEAFRFLRELAANNRRDWFKPRKQLFEDEIQWPLRCLVADVARRAFAEGIPLRADPRKALFRIYRDTRFSTNKDPYKTACGATVSRDGTHRDSGVVYVHVQPGRSFVGAGFWRPENTLLRLWRDRMLTRPEQFLEIVHALKQHDLVLNAHEDMLKRMPRGFEGVDDPEIAPFFRYKSFTVSREVEDDDLTSPGFADDVLLFARNVMPLLNWGWALDDKPSRA